MDFAGFSANRGLFAAVLAVGAVGLSGCFDLEQKVAVRRDGSGTYSVQVAAEGLIARGIDKDHGHVSFNDEDDAAVRRVTHRDGKTIEISERGFHDLSDLRLGDETVSLHVKGANADGTTEVNFHRVFRIDHARHDHDEDDSGFKRDVVETMFDGHTYQFAVWLPGTIEHIAQVRAAGHVVHPTVWTDRTGHTVLWKMDMADALLTDRLEFDVDFAAKGEFHDVQSQPGRHRHHRHHHHDDDDDDDDDSET